VGFRVVERLASRWRAVSGESLPEYAAWWAEPAGRSVALVKPVTFMNRSGLALSAWREHHGLDPAELLVVVDDVYLPVGVLRIRARGSSGGHQGLESIEAALSGREFARLRVGVGAQGDRPPGEEQDPGAKLREHVLEEFEDDEQDAIAAAIERAADAAESWLNDGVLATMNRFNRRVRKEALEP
jgi:PTH1 family peptidyl-tRNA hydrolase